MQPEFRTENLTAYGLPDTDRKHSTDIFVGLLHSSREIVVHASLEKQPNGDLIIRTLDVSREFAEGEYDHGIPVQKLMLEFCRGLQDYVDTCHVLLYPWNEEGEAILKEWKPDHYAMHREWQRIGPLLNQELMAELSEKYPHPDASQN